MSESGQVFAAVFYCTAVFCIHLPEIELSHKLGYNAIKVSFFLGSIPGVFQQAHGGLSVGSSQFLEYSCAGGAEISNWMRSLLVMLEQTGRSMVLR